MGNRQKGLRKRLTALGLAFALAIPMVSVGTVANYGLSLPNPFKIDLSQLKTDSQQVTDLFGLAVKEAGKLLVSVKDIKVTLQKVDTDKSHLKGLSIRSASRGEGLTLLGGTVAQPQNLRLDYDASEKALGLATQSSSLFKTYSLLVDTAYGKDFTKTKLQPLLNEAKGMASGTESASLIGGQWQVSATYGKDAKGQIYLKVGGSSLVKNEESQLKNLIKNTEVSYQSEGLTKHGLLVKDKSTKAVKGMIWTDFKAARVTVSSQGSGGLDLFKGLVNTALKQADPSGKTNFDSVFGKQLEVLKAYESYAQNPSAFKLVDQAGKLQQVASEQALLSPLAEKFNLKDQLMMQDGVPALKVKVGLVEGALYFKDGFVNLSFDLWILK